MPANASEIVEHFKSLKELRSPWEQLWEDIAAYVMPRRSPGMNGSVAVANNDAETRLFDTTAVRANMTLANGQLAWMSPLESAWFAFEPQGDGGDDLRRWLSKATSTAREELAISNFYTAVHEFYLDRSAFGTACLYLEPGKRNSINAQVWPVGTFVIDEDEDGNVDTVIREFQLTVRQAVAKFGLDKVSAKVRKMHADGGKHLLTKVKFIHCIKPRTERDKKKMDAENMPIASVYVDCDSQHVCREGGYEEMPAMVSRYLEWGSGMGSLYGWSPSFAALPEARQLNFLQKMMDALAEKKAFPPVLSPTELEGEIDPNAMGVTYFSRDLAAANAMPREWMTQGNYDIGLRRIEERQLAINQAFHVDLFTMFAQIEKQMTAREVAERAQEKLIQFSPTFARLTGELFNPLLERVVGILARLGKLGDLPGEIEGAPYRIQYSSRIALALRALPSISYQQVIDRLAVVTQLIPSAADNYDIDKAERATALADGLPAEYLRSESDVAGMRQARAEAEQAAAQREQAAAAAKAASDLGRVPAGSPVGNVIQSQLGAA